MSLSKTQLKAAYLLFEDEITDKSVAVQVGIDIRTLRRWKALPEFVDEMAALIAEFAIGARALPLANKTILFNHKIERHQALRRALRRRAALTDPSIPGAEDGLVITRTLRTKEGVEYTEHRFDHATLRELNRLEADITRALDLLPPAPAKVEEVEDLNCLSLDEMEIMEVLYNKIGAYNPGICGPCHRERTAVEKAHAARLIQDGLAQARNSQN